MRNAISAEVNASWERNVTRAGLLEGKVLFVAGVGPGMGAATAQIAVREGAKVVLAARSADTTAAVAKSVRQAGGEALPLQCDFADRKQVEAAIEKALKAYGRVDAAFYNAAYYDHHQSTLDFDEATWNASMGVNLRGPMELARALIPSMIENGGGSFVFNSSGASFCAESTRLFYGVSKAGLNAVLRFIATNYGKHNIRANGVLPFVFGEEGMETPSWVKRLNGLGRAGSAEEIAEAVIFLCSSRSSMITGDILHLDGGQFAKAMWPTFAPK
jgi:NAD(P)-dependent dehydrogenase (short-subunit alcohol dehydrogenase family)